MEFANQDSGSLTITTTRARYALPPVVQRFTARYPKVRLSLRQGSPMQIAELVTSGEADIAIATEAIELFQELVMLPCSEWNRCVVTPPGHPLLKEKPLTLEAISRYPIITYDFAFTGRTAINKAFQAKGLTPNVVLTAIDADVIKTYAKLRLGASWPTWPLIPNGTGSCGPGMPAICLKPASPASASGGTATYGAMPTIPPRCSRPTSPTRWWRRLFRNSLFQPWAARCPGWAFQNSRSFPATSSGKTMAKRSSSSNWT